MLSSRRVSGTAHTLKDSGGGSNGHKLSAHEPLATAQSSARAASPDRQGPASVVPFPERRPVAAPKCNAAHFSRPTTAFLTCHMRDGGLTNQLMSQATGLLMAQALNATYVLPPSFSARADPHNHTQLGLDVLLDVSRTKAKLCATGFSVATSEEARGVHFHHLLLQKVPLWCHSIALPYSVTLERYSIPLWLIVRDSIPPQYMFALHLCSLRLLYAVNLY